MHLEFPSATGSSSSSFIVSTLVFCIAMFVSILSLALTCWFMFVYSVNRYCSNVRTVFVRLPSPFLPYDRYLSYTPCTRIYVVRLVAISYTLSFSFLSFFFFSKAVWPQCAWFYFSTFSSTSSFFIHFICCFVCRFFFANRFVPVRCFLSTALSMRVEQRFTATRGVCWHAGETAFD